MDESRLQLGYIEKLRELLRKRELREGRPFYYFIETMGCQMNARDSEKFAGILSSVGYREAEKESDADFILYNTCTVRENANERVYGRLGQLGTLKKKRPEIRIAICGCMMQEPDEEETVRTKYRFVDLVFGTHNLFRFAELLYRMETEEDRVFAVEKEPSGIVESLPEKRKYSFKAGVNIMYGCDNFCSYCIVPYVRGRERSREPEEILSEIRDLSSQGVKEVMLLGQNVNSYGKTLSNRVSFSKLLSRVATVDGIERVRFMTSHPKDLSDELIGVIAENEKICRHFHLPLQSGSNRILEKMNRHYTRERYMDLCAKLREAVPGIALTTDIIVGFPGETEEDFQDTLDLVSEVRFDSAFTFIYSPRTGTPAAAMPNQVPEPVVKERFDRLLSLVQKIGAEESSRDLGKVMKVLIEEQNRRDPSLLSGRLSNNIIVHFPGDPKWIGTIREVRLTGSGGFYYLGKDASEEE